jgi:hypothetical protein
VLQDPNQQPDSSSSNGVEGGPAAQEAPPTSQLVALGSSTDWVLAPAAVLQACTGGCAVGLRMKVALDAYQHLDQVSASCVHACRGSGDSVP